GRGGKGRGDARDLHGRAARSQAGRSLRHVRRQDARPRRRPPRPPAEVSRLVAREAGFARWVTELRARETRSPVRSVLFWFVGPWVEDFSGALARAGGRRERGGT